MMGRDRPDGERDLIVIVRSAAERPHTPCAGTPFNYLVLREILKRFPQYTGWAVAPLTRIRVDPFLNYFGLTDKMVPFIREFRPWEESIELLSRSKLAIHMEGITSRSNFLLECAACGVPAITTDLPESANFLGIKHGIPNELAFTEAVATGRNLLEDSTLWRMESERLFKASKVDILAQCEWTLRKIIDDYRKANP